jgi:ubiquinol-cytochrome c reductase cytochrome c1 subunit
MLPLATRLIKYFVGAAFVGVLAWSLLWTVVGLIQEPPVETAEHVVHKHPKDMPLPSDGPFGKFDQAQLQRGFKVYQEVCAACHSLNFVSFRELAGLGYSEAEIKKIALDWGNVRPGIKTPVQDPKAGTWGERDNLPSDRIPKAYYPGTGSPPDLSLIAKARHNGGAYVYSLLTGYRDPTAEELHEFPAIKPGDGMYFNPYFANLNLSMPPPLTQKDQVAYTDGTPATVDQMSKDVSAFLVWAAEPTAQTRKQAGLAVVIFLLLTTALAYGAYLSVWRGVKH